MKEPPRLSSEWGPLAEAVAGLRRQTPGSERLSRLAQALAAQGVDVQGIDLGTEPSAAAHVEPGGTEPQGTELASKAGWSTSAKIGAGLGGVLAVGLAALLYGAPAAPDSQGQEHRAFTSSEPSVTEPPEPANAAEMAAERARGTAPSAPGEDTPLLQAPVAKGDMPTDKQPNAAAAPSIERPANETPSPPTASKAASAQSRAEPRPESIRGRENEADALEPALATGESEVSLLKRAREALSANPGTALALAEQHRERFRSGRLAQEREVIAITALVRLGQPTSAEKRADQFMRAYPGSAYVAQIRRVIGED